MVRKVSEPIFKQCKIRKGYTIDILWLPEVYAVKGKFLKLKEKDGTWDDGWQVIDVFQSIKKNVKQIEVLESSYKHQRKMSDV